MIPTKANISTVTDMRRNASGLLKEVEKKGMKYIFQNSKPMAVMINMVTFKRWLDRMDAETDRKMVAEIEKNPKRRLGWHRLESVAAEYGIKL